MPMRNTKKRRQQFKNQGIENIRSFDEGSTSFPIATSSPSSSIIKFDNKMDVDKVLTLFEENITVFFRNERNKLDTFLTNLIPDVSNMLLTDALEFLEKIIENENGNNEKNGGDNETSNFKLPSAIHFKSNRAGTSKSVHWESNRSLLDNSDTDVFKTPLKRKASDKNKSSVLMTPCQSIREPFAVVTPGPMMKKNIIMQRLPQAGEMAVSLCGSPLLVTPFIAATESQAVLTVPTNDGKVMTILPPGRSSAQNDINLLDGLHTDKKKQLKHLATYLLNNLSP